MKKSFLETWKQKFEDQILTKEDVAELVRVEDSGANEQLAAILAVRPDAKEQFCNLKTQYLS